MFLRFFRLATRLTDVEDRLAALERDTKGLEVEWESVYDNVRRALAKISKRNERAAQVAESPDVPDHADGGGAAGELDLSERIRASRRGVR